MLDCFIAGDSIALGLALDGRLGCSYSAKIGISSAAVIARIPRTSTDALIVSAGSNDSANPNLRKNLEAIRAKAEARTMIWILPIDPRARSAVEAVAAAHGDHVVSFAPSRDHVHPRNNHVLAHDVAPFIRATP